MSSAFLLRKIIERTKIKKVFNKNKEDTKLIRGVLSESKAFIGPEEVHIDLTNICNNTCIGCWCNSPLLGELRMPPEIQKQTLSFEVLKRVIDELANMGTKKIKLIGGGEPTLHPHFLDIVEYIRKKGIDCWVNTNFLLINEEIAKRFIELEVGLIDVSLWAATPKTYAKTHPSKTKVDFDKIIKTLKFIGKEKERLGKQKPIIRIYNVIFNMNYSELEEMIKVALDVKADKIQFVFLEPIPTKTDFLLINEEQREELIKICKRIEDHIVETKGSEDVYKDDSGRTIEITNFTKNFIRQLNKKEVTKGVYDEEIVNEIPCYVGWVFARIMADGSVVPCLKAHKMPLGNVNKQSFKEIWNSEEYKKFRQMALNYKKVCPYFSIIGNDPKYGCAKVCDNLWQNEVVHKKFLNFLRKNKKESITFLNRNKDRIKKDYKWRNYAYDWEGLLNKNN